MSTPASDPSVDDPSNSHSSAGLYDQFYYANDLGIPYERNTHWLTFFGGVADRIIELTSPRTVLDVGCAFGFLVEALRDRGVDARGTDVSDYAISQVDGSARGFCEVRSALEPIEGRFDLITCVEVIEHLSADEARAALANMSAATDTILLSTTPDDLDEPTHINVQPVEYWSELMAHLGFFRDVEADTTFLTPWAGLFRRQDPTRARVIRDYERSEYRFRREAAALRHQVLALHSRLAEAEAAPRTHPQSVTPLIDPEDHDLASRLRTAIDAAIAAEAAKGAAQADARQLRVALEAAQIRLGEIDALVGSLEQLHRDQARLHAIESSTTWRLMWRLLTPYRMIRGGS